MIEIPKKINEKVKQLIGTKENIEYCINATSERYKGKVALGQTKNLYVFLTNKKIIFLDKNTFNINERVILLDKIDNISQEKKIFNSDIYIATNSSKLIISNVNKEEGRVFVNKVNNEMENYKTFSIQINKTVERDITDKIDKLAQLYKEGVLTEYEFATKKMELLDKLKE